ncbi:RHOMBOID-LIKE PROTEIN 9 CHLOROPLASTIC [Salix viminalis]|uniref:RHOMBOID-LIKE PROTEIN 9 CHLOROPLASTIC n=1 Tax=Salix viminalis TaxID=40686 RepID=A0A9Q0PAC7_SALVM|nr:RHOMBOID-LIKE PROTEIN 9 CHLOROPLASTIC [Salix viminalis]
MAVVPLCYKIPCKDHTLSNQNPVRQHERFLPCACSGPAQGDSFFSISSYLQKNWPAIPATSGVLVKVQARGRKNAANGTIDVRRLHKIHRTRRENLSVVCCSSESGANEKHLSLLDSYFGKLQDNVSEPSSDSCNERTDLMDANVKELIKFFYVPSDATLENNVASAFDDEATEENPIVKPTSVSKESRIDSEERLRSFRKLRNKDVGSGSRRSEALEQNCETSDFYLIGTLASINIAVFLFEIASPVRNSELALFSLPLLYGAKINDLILVGEWWRLVTPMFLHSGAFHVVLGSWSLLTFGPEVCRGYGSITFFLIYVLGGISGNLTSFLHTPEPAVGGTGPKAVITTGVSFILSHFGPIDDWTHLGAVLTGIVYGFFTCASLQLDDASSRSGQDEGIALVKRQADPCKSLIIFTISILFLSSLLFFVEPPLETVVLEDSVQL